MNKLKVTKFWYKENFINYLLLPLSFFWFLLTFIRLQRKGKSIKPLTVCIGNIVIGGAGKTPFTIFLAEELQKIGIKVAILSRGYGGSNKKPVLFVSSNQKCSANVVGDEALLLSKAAPLVIAKNKYLGAKLLEEKGYQIVLIDDGLQNPAIHKDVNLLLFNTLNPFGNSLIIPAGPLREPLFLAKNRVDVVIGVGAINTKLCNLIKSIGLKYLEAKIKVKPNNFNLSNNYLAFAAIASPDKFFVTLKKQGIKVKVFKTFRDHYLYKDKDIDNLISLAKMQNLRLITTSKDYVKINPKFHHLIDNLEITIDLNKQDKDYLINLICNKLKQKVNKLKT